jgi:hypothetical protein
VKTQFNGDWLDLLAYEEQLEKVELEKADELDLSELFDEADFRDADLVNTVQLAAPMPDGGPDQPEVQSFSPIDVSDMVDPFTGDFSYNIPLMDVDGYPLNIAYNAGVTMDQEASWVGLGWNLNPGVINRNLRGLPDDYNGSEVVTKEMNMRPNWTISGGIYPDYELFGINLKFIKNPSLNLTFNNYNGFNTSIGFNANIPIKNKFLGNGSLSMGFNGSSVGGATINPVLDVSTTTTDETNSSITDVKRKLNIGASYNTRSGLALNTIGYAKTTNKYQKFMQHRIMSSTVTESHTANFDLRMPTYTPSITMPTTNFNIAFRLAIGPDAFGGDFSGSIVGSYNRTFLKDNIVFRNAYGYMFLGEGQLNPTGMLDFNRENDGAFSKNTPAIGIPVLTYDIFSVQGQGIGGSYRAVQPNVGYVFDAQVNTSNHGGNIGLELGIGSTAKNGLKLTYSNYSGVSGPWDGMGNNASNTIRFKPNSFYFREAGELSVQADLNHFNAIGGNRAVHFKVSPILTLSSDLITGQGSIFNPFAPPQETFSGYENSRPSNPRRNQLLYSLTIGELKQNQGIMNLHPDSYAWSTNSQNHHIGEFTVLNTEGTRYVYGLPAFSLKQIDASFSINDQPQDDGCQHGLIPYEIDVDNSISNKNGMNWHFDRVTKPAFAHSYLLTTVLNSDYVDADQITGPSSGDLGGYLILNYKKLGNENGVYNWRNPMLDGVAYFEEGMNSLKTENDANTTKNDNKAHYLYGEKEIWYVEQIISKNHVAVFYTSNRKDALSVNGENGGLLAQNLSMQKLDSIALFSLPEWIAGTPQNPAVPIKTVHFRYNYTLCPGYHGNIDNHINGTGAISQIGENQIYADSGKLTLVKVFFTYENSRKGEYTYYEFKYDGLNPSYNIKHVDRWGSYKQTNDNYDCENIADGIDRPWDLPYATNNKNQADAAASAWNLTSINLPSGGRIEITYESDDYSFVQHKPVHQMYRIIGIEGESNSQMVDLYSIGSTNKAIVVQLETGSLGLASDYAKPGDTLYFRALMRIHEDDKNSEFVPGFAIVEQVTKTGDLLTIQFQGQNLQAPALNIHPFVVAGINYARMYLPNSIPPSDVAGLSDSGLGGLVQGFAGAFMSYGDFLLGANNTLLLADVANNIILGQSTIRLKKPQGGRIGGGHRVKQVKIYDAWSQMSGIGSDFYYGQDYLYTTEDGISSGVAAYEPQLGGDENVWRKPVHFEVKNFLAPNENNFQMAPFGEQFFPSPSVGYSRVTISNLDRTAQGVTRTATGKVVHEFYTAKDYPTIVKRTEATPQRLKTPAWLPFKQFCYDRLVVSQGFVVETNNMHGKPKSQAVYAEGKTEPITKIEYYYNDVYEPTLGHRTLVNDVEAIEKTGVVSNRVIGLNYEAVADFRRKDDRSISTALEPNLNTIIPFAVFPMLWGSLTTEVTEFRSSAFVKVIERFGIQTRTVAYDLGSKVETTNLAWDAETGEVLVTKTKTNFEDDIYSFTYPAHWHYDLMGQAYMNVGKTVVYLAPGQIAPSGMGSEVITRTSPIVFNSGNTGQVNNSIFARGDEVLVTMANNSSVKAWVTESSVSGIRVLDKQGQPINGTVHKIKILRSGRRNLQTTPIGSIVLRENPIPALGGNVFDQVLQAGAVEYSDDWRTFCECFLGENQELYTTNPYVLGIQGTWRPKASYVHLAGRTQTFENQNSNVRDDGFFTSFTPFYRLENGKWVIDYRDWTYTSSVVEFSPFGQALETVDALSRYSSSMYGYNQTLPIAVAANTRYRQLGFDGFEDYMFDNCSDNHFRLTEQAAENISGADAHTGHYSLMVQPNSSVRYSATLISDCDETENVFNPCPLSIMCVGELTAIPETNNMSMMRFVIQGGQGPYSFSFEVNNPQVSYDVVDGVIIIVAPAAHFAQGGTDTLKVTLTVTDQTGCSKVFVLHNFICLPN